MEGEPPPSLQGLSPNSTAPTVQSTADKLDCSAASSTYSEAPVAKNKPRYVRVVTDRRREQCRRSQLRYRRKQNAIEVDLEIEVQRLRLDILQLEERRRKLLNTINTREASVHLVKEFCRVFRAGVRAADSLTSDPLTHEQRAFVLHHVHPDVRTNDACGRDVFVQQLRGFSKLFDDFRLELLRCSHVGTAESSTTMQMDLRLQATVSDTTIRLVFPHLNSSEHRQLHLKLLGMRLEVGACALVIIDEANRVVQLDWNIDLVSALHSFLTLEYTAAVLAYAQIGPEGILLSMTTHRGGVESQEEEQTSLLETHTHSIPRRRPRWYEAANWQDSEASRASPLWQQERQHGGEDDLIHDGQGDDYIML